MTVEELIRLMKEYKEAYDAPYIEVPGTRRWVTTKASTGAITGTRFTAHTYETWDTKRAQEHQDTMDRIEILLFQAGLSIWMDEGGATLGLPYQRKETV